MPQLDNFISDVTGSNQVGAGETRNFPSRVRVAGAFINNGTPTDNDAQNNTLTVAEILTKTILHTSVTGGGTVTTDTAANIIAGVPLEANGDFVDVLYQNDGDQTLTLAGGTNVTIADDGQTIATNKGALLRFVRMSSTTVTVYHVGG